MFVRISRARFDPAKYEEIAAMLTSAQAQLIPAIEQLPGVRSFYAGIDRSSGTMVNVSLWDSEAHAQAMSSLAPMLALRAPFEERGVQFEPIINYEVVWQVA
jgi:hypothetical protein